MTESLYSSLSYSNYCRRHPFCLFLSHFGQIQNLSEQNGATRIFQSMEIYSLLSSIPMQTRWFGEINNDLKLAMSRSFQLHAKRISRNEKGTTKRITPNACECTVSTTAWRIFWCTPASVDKKKPQQLQFLSNTQGVYRERLSRDARFFKGVMSRLITPLSYPLSLSSLSCWFALVYPPSGDSSSWRVVAFYLLCVFGSTRSS